MHDDKCVVTGIRLLEIHLSVVIVVRNSREHKVSMQESGSEREREPEKNDRHRQRNDN